MDEPAMARSRAGESESDWLEGRDERTQMERQRERMGGGMVVPMSEVTCCHGIDDVCVSSGCILGIPGGERSLDIECDAEGCSCHDF